jgi:phosphoserine phosphatase RsbU/P
LKPLRLLIIEDSEDDAMLLEMELQTGGFDPDFLRVETPEELESALEERTWDAVISDYSLPSFTGIDALAIIRSKGLDLPFILVSGVIGEEKAVEAMKAGAHDYIIKGNYSRLVPALERELEDAAVRRGRREAEEALIRAHAELEERVAERTSELEDANALLRERETLLRAVTEGIPDPVFVKDRESRMLLANPATLAAIGRPVEEVLGKNDAEFFDDPAIGRAIMENDRMVMASGSPQVLEETVQTPQGRRVFLSTKLPYRDGQGRIIGTIGVSRDITERKRAEQQVIIQMEDLRVLNEDLTRFNKSFVSREFRMVELKKEINELCEQCGQQPRYPLEFEK